MCLDSRLYPAEKPIACEKFSSLLLLTIVMVMPAPVI